MDGWAGGLRAWTRHYTNGNGQAGAVQRDTHPAGRGDPPAPRTGESRAEAASALLATLPADRGARSGRHRVPADRAAGSRPGVRRSGHPARHARRRAGDRRTRRGVPVRAGSALHAGHARPGVRGARRVRDRARRDVGAARGRSPRARHLGGRALDPLRRLDDARTAAMDAHRGRRGGDDVAAGVRDQRGSTGIRAAPLDAAHCLARHQLCDGDPRLAHRTAPVRPAARDRRGGRRDGQIPTARAHRRGRDGRGVESQPRNAGASGRDQARAAADEEPRRHARWISG